jgi:hypothetical protein
MPVAHQPLAISREGLLMRMRLSLLVMAVVGSGLSLLLPGIGVSPALAATAQVLATPTALFLKAPQGQTATGTLSLRKSGADQHTYHLSANQAWVWMNPPYGSTQTISTETDSLVITAQTTGLSPGIYSAVVYVSDSGPAGYTNLLRIPVRFTVTAAPASVMPPASTPSAPTPQPVVAAPPPVAPLPPPAPPVVSGSGIATSPAALTLTAVKGQTAVGSLALRKGGTDQHSYSLSTNQSWIWMNPPYGSTQTISTETDQLVITVQTTGLTVGTHAAVVYISQSGPNNFSTLLRVPVTMTVMAAGSGKSADSSGDGTKIPDASKIPDTSKIPDISPVVPGPIQVTPLSLTLSKASPSGTITLRKGGTAQHRYSLSASQSWVWMNPPYGSTHTISTEADTLTITAYTVGMAAGTYSATVYIVDSGPNNYSNTIRVPVTLTVPAGPQSESQQKTEEQSKGNNTGQIQPPPLKKSATITWNANTEADLAGYRVYVGTRSGVYSVGSYEVVGRTSFTVPNLLVGTTYIFAVTAFDKIGQESAKSGEFSRSIY